MLENNNNKLFPYPGLRPFLESEARIFFGRRKHENVILEKLRKYQCAFLIGPSGCGKSSLVSPGLYHALESGVRLAGASGNWEFIKFTPRNTPMTNLVETLNTVYRQYYGDEVREVIDHYFVEDSNEALVNCIETMPISEPEGERKNILLVVDQFEQIFEVKKIEQERISAGDEGVESLSDRFINNLISLYHNTPESVYLVFTMRSDYISECTIFDGLPELVNRTQVLMPTMNTEQINKALFLPAETRNVKIQDGLKTRIIEEIFRLKDTDYRRGFDFLPLAQHLMQRLWLNWYGRQNTAEETISPQEEHYENVTGITYEDDYLAVGGLDGALDQHANTLYEFKGKTDQQALQKIARVVLTRLARRNDEGKYITKNATYADLLGLCECAMPNAIAIELLDTVLETFMASDCCFIRKESVSANRQKDLYFIGHEALIRQWQKLRAWVDEDADFRNSFETFRQASDNDKNKAASEFEHELSKYRDQFFTSRSRSDLPEHRWFAYYFDHLGESFNQQAYTEFSEDYHAALKSYYWEKNKFKVLTAAVVLLGAMVSAFYFINKQQTQKFVQNQLAGYEEKLSNIGKDKNSFYLGRGEKFNLLSECLGKPGECFAGLDMDNEDAREKIKLLSFYHSAVDSYSRVVNTGEEELKITGEANGALGIINLGQDSKYIYISDFRRDRIYQYARGGETVSYQLDQPGLIKSCSLDPMASYQVRAIMIEGRDFLASIAGGRCLTIRELATENARWTQVYASKQAGPGEIIKLVSATSFVVLHPVLDTGNTTIEQPVLDVSEFVIGLSGNNGIITEPVQQYLLVDNAGNTRGLSGRKEYFVLQGKSSSSMLIASLDGSVLDLWEIDKANAKMGQSISKSARIVRNHIETITASAGGRVITIGPTEVIEWRRGKNGLEPKRLLDKSLIGEGNARYVLSGDKRFLFIRGNVDNGAGLPSLLSIDLETGQVRSFVLDSDVANNRPAGYYNFDDFYLDAGMSNLFVLASDGKIFSWQAIPQTWANLLRLEDCDTPDDTAISVSLSGASKILLEKYRCLENYDPFADRKFSDTGSGQMVRPLTNQSSGEATIKLVHQDGVDILRYEVSGVSLEKPLPHFYIYGLLNSRFNITNAKITGIEQVFSSCMAPSRTDDYRCVMLFEIDVEHGESGPGKYLFVTHTKHINPSTMVMEN